MNPYQMWAGLLKKVQEARLPLRYFDLAKKTFEPIRSDKSVFFVFKEDRQAQALQGYVRVITWMMEQRDKDAAAGNTRETRTATRNVNYRDDEDDYDDDIGDADDASDADDAEEQERADDRAYGNGWDDGQVAGYKRGFAMGIEEGKRQAMAEGYADAWERGHRAGHKTGHSEGWDDGWYEGYEESLKRRRV